jgi:hypothetical protein
MKVYRLKKQAIEKYGRFYPQLSFWRMKYVDFHMDTMKYGGGCLALSGRSFTFPFPI